jgi:hypothetical protein
MKKSMRFVLFTALVLVNVAAFAAPVVKDNRGVNITIGSIGGPLDSAALRAVRRVVGFSVASGAVDNFVVYSPRAGAIPKEGGMSACAEMGFSADSQKFNGFINELRAIKAKAGTVYTLEPVANCVLDNPVDPIVCTQDVKLCPDGSYVGRVAPSCAFPICPVPVVTPK